MIPREKLAALSDEVLEALYMALVDEVKARRSQKAREVRRAIEVGQFVRSKHFDKIGREVFGRVVKVSQKNCVVEENLNGANKRWILPMHTVRLSKPPGADACPDIPRF